MSKNQWLKPKQSKSIECIYAKRQLSSSPLPVVTCDFDRIVLSHVILHHVGLSYTTCHFSPTKLRK